MVPGSTLRYGSNFCNVTRSPRLSSRHPIDAAAMPLPKDETTPPVTKMNLAIRFCKFQGSLEELGHTFQIRRRVDAQRLVFGFDHTDGVAVFEGAQLFQALGAFERAYREIGVREKKVPAVDVQTDV